MKLLNPKQVCKSYPVKSIPEGNYKMPYPSSLRLLRIILFSSLAMCLYSASVAAQEIRFISDILYVPLRSGAGSEFRIINASLRSGTRLTLLEESEDKEWAKVRTPKETEGWIRAQYISPDIPAKMQLTQAVAKIAKLEQDKASLLQQNKLLTDESSKLQNVTSEQSASNESMSSELQRIKSLAAGAIKLDSDYRELLEKHQVIQTERDALFAENENLKSDQRMDYLLYGAGILILGIIIALVFPTFIPKKGYSEWT